MRKMKAIPFFIILCLLLHGCGLQSAGVTSPSAPTAQSIAGISLGITPRQLFEHLSRENFEIDIPDYAEFPLPEDAADAVPDGRIYNMTDLSFYYKVKDCELYFTFSYEGDLISIHCQDEKISTPKGLAAGDHLDKATELYGSDFEENVEDFPVLQYTGGDGYLHIFYEEDTITHWRFAKYPNINND